LPTEINKRPIDISYEVVKELNILNKQNVKLELQTVLEKITTKAKCIIIYGSHSINYNKEVSPSSDIDFMVIYKNDVNQNKVSRELEKELTKRNIYYDYCWFLEDYFLWLIKNNIDLFLFYSIFRNGEVVYSENDFASQVIDKITKVAPLNTFLVTFNHRKNNINNCLKVWARNLSRILFDYICTLFIKNQNLTKWQNLPNNDEIVYRSKELGVIGKETYVTYLRLRIICKVNEDEIDDERIALCKELASLDYFVENKVKGIIS
jgi:predicted nucleotidyltransferase